jgi:integrase
MGLDTVREKRGLCFHSWRHFFNTFLLAQNVLPHKVAAVLSHSTGAGSMQERYTNWRPEQFPEVYTAPEKLVKELKLL